MGSSVFSADAFVDSVGINIHSWYTPSVPANAYSLLWTPLLSQLGVRHVREPFAVAADTRRLAQHTVAQQLAANGIDMLYVLDSPGFTNEQTALGDLLSSGDPIPGGVEPWNEYDIKPGYQAGNPAQWIQDTRAFQPLLYAAIKAAWPGVPVLTSAVSNNILTTPVGSLLPNTDAANIHLYGPPAVTPEFASLFAPSKLSNYMNQAPPKPLWITETGYMTGLMAANNLATSELAAARLLPRMLLYAWAPLGLSSINSAPAPNGRGGLGAVRTYIYELLDEHDSSDPTRSGDDRYGLFRSDLSPKPAATAIANLLHLLADPGPSFAPTNLSVTATGPYADHLESIVFQKRDGSYWLAFWMGYDVATDPIGLAGNGAGPDLADRSYNVSVQFSRSFQQSALFRPLYGASPVQFSGAVSSATLPARLDVQLLRLTGVTQNGVRARGMRSYYDSRPNSLG